MNEKLIEKKLREEIKNRGGIALKFSSAVFTGCPDRIVLMPSARIWFVELKTTGKKPNQRQKLVMAFLQKLGFEALVIDSEETLQAFFKLL